MAKQLKKGPIEEAERKRQRQHEDNFEDSLYKLESKCFERNVMCGFFVLEEGK